MAFMSDIFLTVTKKHQELFGMLLKELILDRSAFDVGASKRSNFKKLSETKRMINKKKCKETFQNAAQIKQMVIPKEKKRTCLKWLATAKCSSCNSTRMRMRCGKQTTFLWGQ